ncbi:uncharacterized protein N7529_011646 [Penicillium soppii]|uniref:uncharacterized protein n=1 Tax=Penicillium soppii TaxID=69789 RepID=UPI00254726D8|nr:uncharacterized protein N7529_011646 [Penicillium soppii]KAJ5852261.1 hypothetical protein N7529_011646 [Penicillium soppii]
MTTAALFGCTGAVDSQILATLLATDASSSVKTISRRLPNAPFLVFNAVCTTTATAGSIKNQWKIDHDLCIGNARAAKDAGVKPDVYISSVGTRSLLWGWVPYSKMKVGVEGAIKELGFENAIILRPGMTIGRERSKAPILEKLVESLKSDLSTIGRAAVAATHRTEEGKALSRYWMLEQADIVQLGRDEWKE